MLERGILGAGSILLVLCFAMSSGDACAETYGRATMDRLRTLEHGARNWEDRSQTLALQIFDRRGGQRSRSLVMKTKRGVSGEDQTLTVFTAPAELRGTAFLQFSHRDRDAEQWLYLPEMERVRRITSRAKKQSFMGTDFSYRDLELLSDVVEWTETEISARSLGVVDFEGGKAERIELRPAARGIGYERIVVTVAKPALVLRRMEFFEEAEEPVKILHLDAIREVKGIPTPERMVMVQPARGSRTEVLVSEIGYDAGLSARLFSQRSLERSLDSIE
ncbi:MAG: outer membrane lipoprotein-sorting protein [bacterium]